MCVKVVEPTHVLTEWLICYLFVFFTNVRRRAGLCDRCYVYQRFCQTGYDLLQIYSNELLEEKQQKKTGPDEIPIT